MFAPTFIMTQADPLEPELEVSWEYDTASYNNSEQRHTDEWLYGPLPQLICTYMDGENTATRNYRVDWNEKILMTITIPRRLFDNEGSKFRDAHISGTAAVNTSVIRFGLGYDNRTLEWISESTIEDKSDPKPPVAVPFLEMDESNCEFAESPSSVDVTWAIQLNTLAPAGIYFLGFQVFDTRGNSYKDAVGAVENTPLIGLETDEGAAWMPVVGEGSRTAGNGALDIDGNLTTASDQYYIRRIRDTSCLWMNERNILDVTLVFDPSPNDENLGDEFTSQNRLGISSEGFEKRWNDTYIWLRASDFSLVNSSEMDWIVSQLPTHTVMTVNGS
jgi:hypothetical protein